MSGGRTGFLPELFLGRLRWDLLEPFPRQDPADRATGDRAVRRIGELLQEELDPAAVDRTGRLPDGLVQRLRDTGQLDLAGQLGLSTSNVFRVLTAAASWSPAVGFLLAIQNGIGAGVHLTHLPPGPLRDLITDLIASGAVSGMADTEPGGAVNDLRSTTATVTADGYRLDGEKLFIGNGPLADVIVATATVDDGVSLFVVETDTPGFTVTARHEYLGLRGLPSAALRFDNLRLPASRRVPVAGGSWRDNQVAAQTVARGRFYLMAAPSLAIARRCAEWSRQFVSGRRSNGRPLGDYEEIRRNLTATLAEVYAIESVADWVLLGADRADIRYEQVAAKNLTSLAAGRTADRTLSLFGAEGYETADSKIRRGAAGLPVERLFRDARGLRVAGGVDFLVDLLAAEALLATRYGTPADMPSSMVDRPEGPSPEPVGPLTVGNRRHARYLAGQARRLGATCDRLLHRFPCPEDLFAHQRVLILLHRIAAEVLAMATTLARSAGATGPEAQLADAYCGLGRYRLAGYWSRLVTADQPTQVRPGADWLRDSGRPPGWDLIGEGT